MIAPVAAVTDHPVALAAVIGFAVGLALGLGVALRGWFGARVRRRQLESEATQLKSHLHRQMEITGEGNRALKEELESLRKQNENLRVTVKTLENKPGRAEVRTLHVYDRAVHLMNAEAPGFAPAWERAFAEAEEQVKEADTGLSALVRRIIRPVLPGAERGKLPGGKEDEDS
jgi:uncharacterized protein HemX